MKNIFNSIGNAIADFLTPHPAAEDIFARITYRRLEKEKVDEICRLINEGKIRPDIKSSLGNATLLHQAAIKGYPAIAESALAYGMHPDTPHTCGETPLYFAAGANHLDVVKLLVEKGADINGKKFNPLYSCLCYNHLEIAAYLLEKGADPGVINECNYISENGRETFDLVTKTYQEKQRKAAEEKKQVFDQAISAGLPTDKETPTMPKIRIMPRKLP